MKDSLKDFIENNRGDFDDRLPSEKVWTRIKASMTGHWKINIWQSVSVWRAAAVIFFGLSAFLFLSGDYNTMGRKEASRLQGEFSHLESFYKAQIAEKVAFIEDFENAYEDDRVTQDLQKLDAMYQVLREEMKVKPSEKVIDAVVLNMLIRIDLLNQQIKQLEDLRKKRSLDGLSI